MTLLRILPKVRRAFPWVALLVALHFVSAPATRAQETGKADSQSGATGGSAGTSASLPPELEQLLEAYAGQKVSSVELAGRPELDDRDLLPLLEQHEGEPLEREKVERTVAAIRATGKFQDVQLDVVSDVEGVRVLLILQPAAYFGIYEFSGSGNFSYSRLLQVANYLPETPYNRKDVAQASEALTRFFQQSGYFLAKVASQIEPDAARGIVNVRFTIVLGPRAKFGKVILAGASPEQAAQLQAKLKSLRARLRNAAIRQGKRYSFKTIQNATQYMQNALVKQDRLGAQVKMVGAEYDAPSNRADISFQIAEGPLVHVRTEGAHVGKSTQRKLIPLYQQVGVDDELVEEGRKNLISNFQSKGYFDAAVETSVSQQGGAETILYKIEKGRKHKVASVRIEGNKALEERQLLAHVGVHRAKLFSHGAYSEKLLRSSTKNLEATYRSEGFSAVKVTPKIEGKGSDIDVIFQVNEGPRDIVKELRVEGNDTMPVSQLVPQGLKLVAGQPYSQRHADEDRTAITVKYLESGYLTSSLRETIASEKSEPHSLVVTYLIHEGPRVTTSSVVTLGRVQTAQRLIDRAAKFPLHQPLTTGDLLSSESRLYAPAIFDWAEVAPRRPITAQTEEDVLVKVHEARRHRFTYGFGFEVVRRGGSLPSGTVAVPGLPPVGANSNFRTSVQTFWGPLGSLEYTRKNIFGLAQSFTAATLAGRLLQRVTANFHNPSFRGTSFASNLNASFEHNSQNPIFTDRIEQGGIRLQKPLDHNKTQHLNLLYSFSETQITNLLIPDLVPPSDQDVRLSTLSATYSRDTRDNPLDAKRGTYQSLEVDLNPEALGSSVSFVKTLVQVAAYQRLKSDVIWANSVRLGFESAFAGSQVPLPELFFTGGGSTIRGFPLNGAGPQRIITACGNPSDPTTCSPITVPEGGRQLFIVNSELRVPLPIRKGLGVVGFYDGGNVFRAIGFHGEYTNTVGGGLRYATPVGPVRFDVGYNLNAPQGVNALQYFITLGQAF